MLKYGDDNRGVRRFKMSNDELYYEWAPEQMDTEVCFRDACARTTDSVKGWVLILFWMGVITLILSSILL